MAPDEAAPDLDPIREILDEGEAGARFAAEERLRRWAPTADADALRDALRDPRNEISGAAATELAARDDHAAIEALVREVSLVKRCDAARDARDAATYPYSEPGDLQHGAHARALVKLDDPAAVPPLIDALHRVTNPWVKWEIAWVLGRLGDPAALPPLEAELEAAAASDDEGWPARDRVETLARAVERLRNAGH